MRFLVILLAVTLAATPGPQASDAPSLPRHWVDGRDVGRPLLDLSDAQPLVLPVGAEVPFALADPLTFRGGLYDTVVIGPEPGRARLAWQRDGASDGPTILLEPLGASLRAAPGASVQVRTRDGVTAVRWLGLQDAFGWPASFEVVIAPPHEIAYQYFHVPRPLRNDPSAAGIRLTEEQAGATRSVEPALEGFRVTPGEVVLFPGEQAWEAVTGCDIASSWCTTVQAYDPGCRTPSPHNDETPCSTTQAQLWHFNEGAFCRSCPYTFYVAVECGTEMHLPFRDCEGNVIRIIDVFTGTQLGLEAINDCARAPFLYCNRCVNSPPNTIVPAPPTGCGTTPTVACEPYLQRSTEIAWGWPRQDLDGDTIANELPCGPPNGEGCTGPYRTGNRPDFEEQNVDVVLRGDPALCGVFRIEITSGGYHWFLAANCSGIVPQINDPTTIAQNFVVYQNCADALAAFDPVPELAITNLEINGVCPNITVTVEVTNIGCTDSTTAPVLLDFSRANEPDLDIDLGVVPAGSSVERVIPVSLRSTPQTLTATVDPMNVIPECTEQPQGSFSGCSPTAGSDSMTVAVCACANTVQAVVAEPLVFSCDRAPTTIDASASTAVPCAGGTLEYRFLDDAGGVVRDWSTSSQLVVTPTRCPSRESYQVQARCSLEPLPDCWDTVRDIEVECNVAPTMSVSAAPTEVCAGDLVRVEASPGFVSYSWSNGRTGRVIQDRPTADTSYQVTGMNIFGCQATGSAMVSVTPDPLPGPLGNTLRAWREAADVVFSYRELSQPVMEYQLLAYEPEPSAPPCANPRAGDPWPAVLQALPATSTARPGDPPGSLRHQNGIETCPRLIFYKVVGTSPCASVRGPACDGFPRQFPPCP